MIWRRDRPTMPKAGMSRCALTSCTAMDEENSYRRQHLPAEMLLCYSGMHILRQGQVDNGSHKGRETDESN